MPKVIDHNAYREELAQRTIPLFSQHGYHGLSMRKIAEALTVSKSALYHYFPAKADLFEACTAMLVRGIQSQREHLTSELTSPTTAQKLSALRDINDQLTIGFGNEMALMFDYLRGKSTNEIKKDKSMVLANSNYRDLFIAITGEDLADITFSIVLGNLMRCHFLGEKSDFSDIQPQISILLDSTGLQDLANVDL
ncbi:MAG: AcrR family transcriptional regulator [Psychromonas sp.]|jgi:AcrR family transcriptional regulator